MGLFPLIRVYYLHYQILLTMKHSLFCLLTISTISFVQCKKETEPVTKQAHAFKGSANQTKHALEVVFTSPTESHYEWVDDTIHYLPDTLRIAPFSADSFELKGSAAEHLPLAWRKYAFAESASTDTLRFERSESFLWYYSQSLKMTFIPARKTWEYEFHSDRQEPPTFIKISFEGEEE